MLRVEFDLSVNEELELLRHAVMYGYLREEPRKPITTTERKAMLRWTILHIIHTRAQKDVNNATD